MDMETLVSVMTSSSMVVGGSVTPSVAVSGNLKVVSGISSSSSAGLIVDIIKSGILSTVVVGIFTVEVLEILGAAVVLLALNLP